MGEVTHALLPSGLTNLKDELRKKIRVSGVGFYINMGRAEATNIKTLQPTNPNYCFGAHSS